MADTSEAREQRDRVVSEAHGRAVWAVRALFATAIASVYVIAAMAWQSALGDPSNGIWQRDRASSVFDGLVHPLLRLLTAALFLRWLARTVTAARDLTFSPPLTWTASKAVWGFFIPVINFYRPYQVMRDLHDRLAPDGVPEPAPRPRMDGAGGYRRVEMEKAPPKRALPHASIGAWWGLYLFGGLTAQGAVRLFTSGSSPMVTLRQTVSAGALAEIASATLAILVVRAIDGRLAERHRRLHHATDEELTEWGFDP